MNAVLALLGFAVIVVLLVGVFVSLFGDGDLEQPSEEWPVLAEAENAHQVHALKGVLDQENVPSLLEEESSEAGGLPTTLTRNVLRVPPARLEEAVRVIRNSDLDTGQFRLREGGLE